MVTSTRMVVNLKEWKDLIVEKRFKNNLKKLIFGEIKKIIKWGWVLVKDLKMLLNQWLNLNGMLTVLKSPSQWLMLLKTNNLKLFLFKKNKLGIDGLED